MPVPPIIEVDQLSKRYQLGRFGMTSFREESEKWLRRLRGRPVASIPEKREFWALRDVSFTVNPGEVVGIIGKNGAGKSTLLKILSRITDPTGGEAVLRGRVASLLEVGTGFHPELSGRENIFLNGAILGMKRAEIAAKFDEIVAFSEIHQFIDTPVKRYSSGMYVRLAFAVAAHLEPDILIVDEVLAVGDAAFQKKCVAKMGEVSGHGRTVLFVSHNLGLIQSLCKTAILLESGRLAFHGGVDDALRRYGKTDILRREFHRSQNIADAPGPRIASVALRNRDGTALFNPESGCEIEVMATQPAPRLGALIFIRNEAGVQVLYFNTAAKGRRDRTANESPKRFLLQVPQLHLPTGHYTVDVQLWLPEGCSDVLESAVTFEIADGFFQERQASMFHGRCVALVNHEWSVE